eukprot:g1512.t1
MARTFTGLKLQGDIGKFGKVELSDVQAYSELPTGLILSSTERGTLLVWDGNFIKVEIFTPGGNFPHNGAITCIELDGDIDGDGDELWFVTAGADGYVKWWSYDAIDNADTTEDVPQFELAPMHEIKIGQNVEVKSMVRGKNYWMVQDGNGGFWKVNCPENRAPANGKETKTTCLQRFHGKGIQSMDASPIDHFAVTCGKDGAVQCWDYVEKKPLFSEKFYEMKDDKRKEVTIGTVVQWAPLTVDSNGRTVAVGFQNGIVRMLLRGKESWKLSHVMKPHSGSVSSIVFSNKGERLMTSSVDDKTIWFFGVEQGPFQGLRQLYEPIGFLQCEEIPQFPCFNNDDSGILVTYPKKGIVEYNVPDRRDTSKTDTFDISKELNIQRFWQYTRPEKIDINAIAEANSIAAAEAGGGADTRSDEEKQNAIDVVVEEIRAQKVPESARCAIYCSGTKNNVVMSLEGTDSGTFHEIQLVNQTAIYKTSHPCHEAPLTVLRYSSSGKLLLTGSEDGTIHVRASNGGGNSSFSKKFACIRMHDAMNGAITGVATSFDDKFLLSTGKDEMFFIQELQGDEIIKLCQGKPKSKDCKFETAEIVSSVINDNEKLNGIVNDVEAPEDIILSSHYTIEDDKLKTEEDNRRRRAEVKKNAVREKIKKLQNEFSVLREENERSEVAFQLTKSEMDVDPELTEYFKSLGEKSREEVRKELAWSLEKSKVKLRKLLQCFLDDVLVESITMKAFDSEHRVNSFRVRKRSDSEKRLRELIVREADQFDQRDTSLSMEKSLSFYGKFPTDDINLKIDEKNEKEKGPKDAKEKGKEKHSNWEERKKMRQERYKRLAALEKQKPSSTEEDPQDVEAIRDAKENMGDYKLKTDDNYTVPKNKQLNTAGKRREMVLLEIELDRIMMDFNARFLSLRNLKAKIIEKICKQNARIRVIDNELDLKNSSKLFKIKKDPSEWPEERNNCTMNELLEFEMNQKKLNQKLDAPSSQKPSDDNNEKKNSQNISDEIADVIPEDDALYIIENNAEEELSQTEKNALERRRKILLYEKSQLLNESKLIRLKFDTRLKKMREEKMKLDRSIKVAEIDFIVLYHEMNMLRVYKERDENMETQLKALKEELRAVKKESKDTKKKLAIKKNAIAAAEAKVASVEAEFVDLIGGEQNPLYPALYKIFKRKIKRNKKRADNLDDDYSSEESSSEEESSDDDDGEEKCPEGCKPETYENVIELRERRLDESEILNELTKAKMELVKAERRHNSRITQIMKEVEGTESEIALLVTEKQKAANGVKHIVALRLDQIRNLQQTNGNEIPENFENFESSESSNSELTKLKLSLPSTLNNCLVFSKIKLKDLRSRIEQLEMDKTEQLQIFKGLQRRQRRLVKGKKAKEREIKALSDKCNALQLLKFGRTIDIDSLDNMQTSRAVLELHNKIKLQSVQNEQVIRKMNRAIKVKKEKMMEMTTENTAVLEKIAKLTGKLTAMESEMGSGGKKREPNGPGGESAQVVTERKRLVQLVRLQAREIDALKTEINMLRRKGGHVYGDARGHNGRPEA